MDSNYDDSDDSSLFLKTLSQKRKASDNVSHKTFKQAKLNLPKSQNSQTEKKEPDIKRGNSKSDDYLLKIIGKDGMKSFKNLENDSESSESISSYFGERKGSNTCPLCLKRFETDSGYATHMKQCAKKRKMTTQQLLTALELQKKQIKERKALGLPSQIIAPKKPASKKKAKEEVQSDYDLALGLALSKSLDPKESQKSTLQEFGFTYNGPGPSKKKIKDLKKSILKERTQEERQRILTEKAAVVLLDEDEESNSGSVVANQNSCNRNDSLTKFQNRVPRLWNLGEDERNEEWYVNDMKELMRIEEEEEENEDEEEEADKEKEKEEEDDQGKEKEKEEDQGKEKEKEEDQGKEKEKEEDQGKEKEKEEDQDKDKEKEKDEDKEKEKERDEDKEKEGEKGDDLRRGSMTQENLTREIGKLKLPKEGIHLDWKKMINNDKYSNMVGKTKDSETVYMHSIVLYARCPDVLEKCNKSILSKYLLSTVLIFLEYLYCGTLNGLTSKEFNSVSKLASDLNYKELANVLNRLENNIKRAESSEEIIPSSLTPGEEAGSEDNEISIIDVREGRKVTTVPEKDLFVEEMMGLTQSHHCSSVPGKHRNDEVESNADKSYWSFVQERRREQLKAELKRREEEKEKSMISDEMEKIKASMAQQNKTMQKIDDEFEEDETNLKELLEVDGEEEEEGEGEEEGEEEDEDEHEVEEVRESSPTPILTTPKSPTPIPTTRKSPTPIPALRSPTPTSAPAPAPAPTPASRNRSNDSATKDLFDNVQRKEDVEIDCIVLSSDSESRGSKGEEEDGEPVPADVISKPQTALDYEAPLYDPYDNFNDFSNFNFSPVMQHSQSMVSEIAPFPSPLKKTSNERSVEEGVENRSEGPEYFSTPVTKRQSLSKVRRSSSEIASLDKRKKRKSALGASLIIRKSLGLVGKKSEGGSAKKKSKKGRKSSCKEKNVAKVLTDSVLSELSTSFKGKTSTPDQNRIVEMTPRTTRDVDFGEVVTPDPNFSVMGDSMLKEHLSKYGLKKSLAKTKARKILRHIYEELHPIINTETGKLVKIVPNENSKGRKKGGPKKTEKKRNSTKSKKQEKTETETATATKEPDNNINDGLSKPPDLVSDGSVDSFERSTDFDSDRSEFEDLQEPMTQSVANNPVDLPSALNEFLNRNPEFHQKILLYEPIWLEELQRQMKEVFQKHFKLSDLMDYLDQKCITFRSEAQKKTNEKKNQKTKKSKQSKEKKKSF